MLSIDLDHARQSSCLVIRSWSCSPFWLVDVSSDMAAAKDLSALFMSSLSMLTWLLIASRSYELSGESSMD
jgi:hypothetical protein